MTKCEECGAKFELPAETLCENCHEKYSAEVCETYGLLQNKIKELKQQADLYKRERDAYAALAEQWMADHDKLKEKYEPSVVIFE